MLGQLKWTARAVQSVNITSSTFWLAITPSCSCLQQVGGNSLKAKLYDLTSEGLACYKGMFPLIIGVEQHLRCMSLMCE